MTNEAHEVLTIRINHKRAADSRLRGAVVFAPYVGWMRRGTSRVSNKSKNTKKAPARRDSDGGLQVLALVDSTDCLHEALDVDTR